MDRKIRTTLTLRVQQKILEFVLQTAIILSTYKSKHSIFLISPRDRERMELLARLKGQRRVPNVFSELYYRRYPLTDTVGFPTRF